MKCFTQIVILTFILFFGGCGKDSGGSSPVNTADVYVNFSTSSLSITEGELDQTIKVQLTEAVSNNTSVNIRVESSNTNIERRLSASPQINNGIITVIINGGSTEEELIIASNNDVDVVSEMINLEIDRVNGNNIEIGNTKTLAISIEDQSNDNPQYIACLPKSANDTLEIATWNIRTLPQDAGTVDALIPLIELMDVDIIAVQEIQEPTMFEALANGIDGWESKWLNVNGSIELGFLYKSSEITAISDLTALFTDDFSPFPREAVVVDITHVSGISVKLINIHLKCCSDGADRRAVASTLMKSYIDDNWSDQHIIIAGDFNESITGSNSFDNFLMDTDNYFFADSSIANGDNTDWSFPNFPSHIDHILCTNELMDNFISSETMNLDPCVVGYQDIISDHRPVIARFK